MPSFNQEQKAFIKQVVYEASPHIIAAHVESCPWGQKMSKAFWLVIGIAIGTGLVTVTTVAAIVRYAIRP